MNKPAVAYNLSVQTLHNAPVRQHVGRKFMVHLRSLMTYIGHVEGVI